VAYREDKRGREPSVGRMVPLRRLYDRSLKTHMPGDTQHPRQHARERDGVRGGPHRVSMLWTCPRNSSPGILHHSATAAAPQDREGGQGVGSGAGARCSAHRVSMLVKFPRNAGISYSRAHLDRDLPQGGEHPAQARGAHREAVRVRRVCLGFPHALEAGMSHPVASTGYDRDTPQGMRGNTPAP